jgi:hypothetical protein
VFFEETNSDSYIQSVLTPAFRELTESEKSRAISVLVLRMEMKDMLCI